MEKRLAIIITMAGTGSRFKDAGYNIPKYQIKAKGKTLFEWSMDSLLDYNIHTYKYIFVVKKEDNASDFIKKICNKYQLSNIDIIEIDHLTDGQATTCMLAIPYCHPDDAILVYNIDTYVEPYELKYSNLCGDGHIPCFYAEGTHWSFVKLNLEGKVIEVKEKERISNNCSIGAYYFSSAKLYQQLYDEFYKGNEKSNKNEKYISPLFNYMLQKNLSVSMSNISAEKVHVLGTPEELNCFLLK